MSIHRYIFIADVLSKIDFHCNKLFRAEVFVSILITKKHYKT